MIDQSLLRPEATQAEVEFLCAEADRHGFAAVFVNSSNVRLCAGLLERSAVKVGTVSGFPLGACATEVKVCEALFGIDSGAEEIDMVMNIGALKSGQERYVENEIKAVVKACQDRALVKVIIEAALLTNEEKVKVCQVALRTGADFVKTSTGFGYSGATVEDVALMRQIVGEKMGVKASGGIRDYQTAIKLVKAGANRIGTSCGGHIVMQSGDQTIGG